MHQAHPTECCRQMRCETSWPSCSSLAVMKPNVMCLHRRIVCIVLRHLCFWSTANASQLQLVVQGVQSDDRLLLLSQCSIASSVERHSSEESETIVCSLLASPIRGNVSSASPVRYASSCVSDWVHECLWRIHIHVGAPAVEARPCKEDVSVMPLNRCGQLPLRTLLHLRKHLTVSCGGIIAATSLSRCASAGLSVPSRVCKASMAVRMAGHTELGS